MLSDEKCLSYFRDSIAVISYCTMAQYEAFSYTKVQISGDFLSDWLFLVFSHVTKNMVRNVEHCNQCLALLLLTRTHCLLELTYKLRLKDMASLPLMLESNWSVITNTIFFEVILANVLFYLTADVCARLNYLSLCDGSVQKVYVQAPPLLNGGIISTNRRRTILMIALRGFGIALILGTTLTIDGDSVSREEKLTKKVRVPAPLSNETSTEDIKKLLALRFSCAVSVENALVFGRLDDDNYCETNSSLLTESVRITIPLVPLNFSASTGCSNVVTNLTEYQKFMTTRCEQGERKATVLCYSSGDFSEPDLAQTRCAGTFMVNKSNGYACDGFEGLYNESSISLSITCHLAKNLNGIHNIWPTVFPKFGSVSIIDLLGVVSVAAHGEREVIRNVKFDITRVHSMWLLCLTLKLLIISVLALVSAWLRAKKTKRVLHDDRELLLLLRKRLSAWMGTSMNADHSIYLRVGKLDEEYEVWASSLPNFNANSTIDEDSTGHFGQTDMDAETRNL